MWITGFSKSAPVVTRIKRRGCITNNKHNEGRTVLEKKHITRRGTGKIKYLLVSDRLWQNPKNEESSRYGKLTGGVFAAFYDCFCWLRSSVAVFSLPRWVIPRFNRNFRRSLRSNIGCVADNLDTAISCYINGWFGFNIIFQDVKVNWTWNRPKQSGQTDWRRLYAL